jgi:NADPH:quinone reductase-like Zn-dependent oxidoreductase
MRSSFEAGQPPMRTTWFYSSRRRRKDLTVRIKASTSATAGPASSSTIAPVIDRRYPLEDPAEALAKAMRRARS